MKGSVDPLPHNVYILVWYAHQMPIQPQRQWLLLIHSYSRQGDVLLWKSCILREGVVECRNIHLPSKHWMTLFEERGYAKTDIHALYPSNYIFQPKFWDRLWIVGGISWTWSIFVAIEITIGCESASSERRPSSSSLDSWGALAWLLSRKHAIPSYWYKVARVIRRPKIHAIQKVGMSELQKVGKCTSTVSSGNKCLENTWSNFKM